MRNHFLFFVHFSKKDKIPSTKIIVAARKRANILREEAEALKFLKMGMFHDLLGQQSKFKWNPIPA